jgi:hypothetical protein
MKLQNMHTGDVVELPPPDRLGTSVVLLNGRVVEHVLYSDKNGGSATTGDGRVFTIAEWTTYVAAQLASGAWRGPEVQQHD